MSQETVAHLQAVLGQRYALIREIGRGGMATVHLAEDRESDSLVAVKVLDEEVASGLDPARFAREIRIASALTHPGILPILDSGSGSGLLYYVTPYVAGGSLRQRLDREGRLSVSDALALTRALAPILDHAHAHGVVHRDVKPENILLADEGVFLADFGIARMLVGAKSDRVTGTGQAVGTPAYASPEQAAGEKRIDHRADIYSLGCVLYEMLAGEPPFTGATPQAVIARQIIAPAPSLEIVRPDLPRAVTAAITRALSKTPADRFESAAALVAALEAPRPVASRSAVRRRALLAAAVVLAVGATATILARSSVLRRVVLDPDKVVVFPLAATSAIGDPSAGWDVALAIGAALEHTEPLRFIDGWTWLDETAREDPASVTADAALELSRRRSAAYYVTGAIRTSGDSLAVVVRLHDVVGDSLVDQETASGSAAEASLPGLGLQAFLRILPKLVDPERPVDLTPLTDRNPGATALWLQGERAYRQSHFDEAFSLYTRATEEDPLHAFAAVKGAQAASWSTPFESGRRNFDEARQLIELALREKDLLPPRYQALATGLSAYFRGDAEGAEESFREALDADPEWSEAATALGEVYVHLLPRDAVAPDSQAAHWFGIARAHDPMFSPPLFHLTEIALRDGDTDHARQLLSAWERFQPDTVLMDQVRLSLACESDSLGFEWAQRLPHQGRAVLQAGISLAGSAARPRCARGALRAVFDSPLPTGWRESALWSLQGLAIAEGHYQEVDSLFHVALGQGISAVHWVYTYDALAGAPFAEQADNAEGLITARFGDVYAAMDLRYRWLMASRLIQRGETDRAARVAGAMAASAGGDIGDGSTTLAAALRARVQATRGDTAAAVESLRVLVPSATRYRLAVSFAEPLAPERVLLAELLLARGDAEAAYRAAALLDHPAPVMYLPFLPRSLAIRARAAQAMNRPDLAARARDRLAALGWPDPDAFFPPIPPRTR